MTNLPSGELALLDGRFQLESLLGRGGMAEVYRATDVRYGRAVAVKILRDDVLDAMGIERFRREITVTAAFTHPHILGLLESGETARSDGRRVLYYVMPLVEGETLSGRLAREDHLSVPDAVRITREVLEALRYAHDHGVIHRDIKPANILLSGGHAVVADFGIARPVLDQPADGGDSQSLTVSGVAVGTPAYMSPEQAFAGATVDGRCDLYATGCVFYEMLTGRAPFDASTGQAVMARKMNGAFVPPSTMRPGMRTAVDEIVARALTPDPADRFPSATAFLAALEKLGDVPTSRTAANRAPGGLRASTSRARSVIGVVFAAGLLLAAWFASRGTRDKRGENLAAVQDPARIVVLPFENLSADTLLAYVANGITTDLIDELAQVRALTVVSKNGVLPFLNKAISLDSMARALRVRNIITGDVRRSGDKVSVSVRLVDGKSGQQLASHDTAATPADVLSVRSAVVGDAAEFLRKQLGQQVVISTARRGANNPEAWQLVERASALRNGELTNMAWKLPRVERSRRFQHADSFATVAARLDKRWSGPLVERANLAIWHAAAEETVARTGGDGAKEGLDEARRYWRDAVDRSNEALARDPRDAAALRARGTARKELWRTSRDAQSDSLRTLAEKDLRAAVDLRPDLAVAWMDMSLLFELAGNYAEADHAVDEAVRADEYLSNDAQLLSRHLFLALGAEQYDRAAALCAEGRRRYPDDPRFFACEVIVLGWTSSKATDVGRAWAALDSAEKRFDENVLRSGWGTHRMFIACIAARAQLKDSALAIIARTRTGLPPGASTSGTDLGEARARALLGQRDDALRLLGGYLAQFPIQRLSVARSPWFKSLRADPRFVAMTATR